MLRIILALVFFVFSFSPVQGAVLVTISSETAEDGQEYIGDVVGIFADGHQFSETELVKFNFVTVGGTRLDVETRLDQIKPQTETAYQWESDGNWHWVEPEDQITVNSMEVYRIRGTNRWYELVNEFNYDINVSSLSAEEKQLIETTDINHPAVDSFIRKVVKDLTVDPANNIEVKDLRNTEP